MAARQSPSAKARQHSSPISAAVAAAALAVTARDLPVPVPMLGRLGGKARASLGLWAASLAAVLACGQAAQAQLAVSEGGNATYGQEITVPPGVAGMAPKLSLLYVGGGVNGPVGHGWSIQGLSVITRCPATLATDGVRAKVSYAAADKICLDGQRLIETTADGVPLPFPQANEALGLGDGAYTEYRTEKDMYARIRAYGYAGGDTSGASGPQYFKVWTKAGQIYEYGASPSADANTKALITAQGKTVAMAWAVARISDTLGNRIDFKYEQRDVGWGSGPTAGSPSPGHEWNILEIQYSGNKVVFSYADRAGSSPEDAAEAYHQGSKNVSVRRLQSITTYVNATNTAALGAGAGVAVKTVKLTYDRGGVSGRSRVTRIQECAGGANSTRCLPGASFEYSNGGSDAYQASAQFNLGTLTMQSTSGSYGVLTGDFNGDSRTDFIRWSNTPSENRLFTSNGDGSFTEVPVGTGPGQFNLTDLNLFQRPAGDTRADRCYMSVVGDFNGDGLPDILRWAAPTTAGMGRQCAAGQQSLLLLSKGDGSFTRMPVTDYASGAAVPLARTVPTIVFGNCWANPNVPCIYGGNDFFIGDFNADGIADIAEVRFDFAILPISGNSFLCGTGDSSTCHLLIRFGRADGRFEAAAYAAPFYSNPERPNTFVMDMDGDGLSDLVVRSEDSTGPGDALISIGNGQFTRTNGALPACTDPNRLSSFNFGDFNGDNRADFICAQPAVASNSVYLSSGSVGFVINAPAAAAGKLSLKGAGQDLVSSTNVPGASYSIADVNGDGRSDVIRVADAPASNVLYVSNGDGTFSQSGSFTFDGTAVQLAKSDGTADFLIGDFTGHGNVEFLRVMNGAAGASTTAAQNRLYVKVDPTSPDQLLSVTAPGGTKTVLHYASLANPVPSNGVSGNYGPRYASDRGTGKAAVLPQTDVSVPMPVVVTTVSDSGVGGASVVTEYGYAGLKADTSGRGMLGFREVRRQSPAPNGESLTVVTQYLQGHPYTGVASRSDTYRGTLAATLGATPLSSSVNVYCDVSASAAEAGAATSAAPCATSAKLQRPYLLRSTESGTDLAGIVLPQVVTENTFNASGDPTRIVVTTIGTAAGISQSFVKTTTNEYKAEDLGCSDVRTCNWVRGRLSRASVTSSVPNSLPAVSTSPGSAPNAAATVGQGPLGSVPIRPEVLAIILQLLLDD